MGRHAAVARVLAAMEWFVRKTGWVGLTVLLAIPFMSDTAVNYFYSLLNEEGHAVGRWHFVLANLIGGIARTYLFLELLPRRAVSPRRDPSLGRAGECLEETLGEIAR